MRNIENLKNWNNHNPDYGQEKVDQTSMTVPNMALSVQDILERYTRGQALPLKQPQYFESDEPFPDPKTLDLVEQRELIEELQEVQNTAQQQIEAFEKERKAKPAKAGTQLDLTDEQEDGQQDT